MKYKLVVFDMDGTVLNTLNDLQDAVNFALSKFSFPPRSFDEIKSFVGNGIPKLIERSVPTDTDENIRKAVYDVFTPYYQKHCMDKTTSYDGITELLASLKKAEYKTAVVSNKDDYAVKELVKVYFPGGFDFSLGRTDGVDKKPAPDMVNRAMEYFNVEKTEAVYVGDSDVDFMTAKNSGLEFIGVSWGFKGRNFLQNLGAERIADDAKQLFEFIVNA